MAGTRKKEALILFLGDIALFFLALWITLFLRYQTVPDEAVLVNHVVPFSFLFVVWVVVFFIAGLYDNHTMRLKGKLPSIILKAQLVNVALAALFFFLIPYFGITPKTNLIIYLFVSFGLIVIWRLYIFSFLRIGGRQRAILIGRGKELAELEEEINSNTRYDLKFVLVADLDIVTKENLKTFQEDVLEQITSGNVSVIVADTKSEIIEPFLPLFYNLAYMNLNFRFLDIHALYENIFERVPLSMIEYEWFLVNISPDSRFLYSFLKRIMDVFLSLFLTAVLIILYPFIALAIKLEDNGPIFIKQQRIGQFNKPLIVRKIRTMRVNDPGTFIGETKNTITRIGTFLRRMSLDEYPQVINVFKGEMSLIGPRSDISNLGTRLAEEISYYNVRYTVKPGITGWAQTHQQYAPGNISPQSIEESRVRLAYDLYYIKNRSFILDVKIALQTIKALLVRAIAKNYG